MGIFVLLILIGLIVLNYWATSRIIAQAGYSPLWILLPIAPFVLTIICLIISFYDLHEIVYGGSLGIGGFSTVGFAWHLDQVTIFLNWIFYLVFAFSRWPVSGASYSSGPVEPRPPAAHRATPGPGPVPPTPGAALPTARVVPTSGASPGTGPAAVPSAPVRKGPTAQYCAWCGEALPGNRSLFHDCGPKDRPETVCKYCGKELPAAATECPSCASV